MSEETLIHLNFREWVGVKTSPAARRLSPAGPAGCHPNSCTVPRPVLSCPRRSRRPSPPRGAPVALGTDRSLFSSPPTTPHDGVVSNAAGRGLARAYLELLVSSRGLVTCPGLVASSLRCICPGDIFAAPRTRARPAPLI